ncbi:MAG: hypothetical protein V1929_12795 [bacterium]
MAAVVRRNAAALLCVVLVTSPAWADGRDARHAERVEDFEAVESWQTGFAPGTSITLTSVPGVKGKALGLNYDFGDTQAYMLASKSIPLALPEDFEFSFFVKRTAPDNSFEFKLIDAEGNTFMRKWYAFGSVGAWKRIAIRKKDITWAWGPGSSAKLDTIQTIEFAVTGGKGRGQVCIDELALKTLPPGAAAEVPESNGRCPRWLSDEQAFWTLAGVPGDDNEALLCEDGTIEPHKRGFSILPVVYVNGALFTRNEARVTQSLERHCLPIPSVSWDCEGVTMDVQLFAHGAPGVSVAYARYSITNERDRRVSGHLRLLVQPYQVYPPWQGGGGFSPITNIAYAQGVVSVNGRDRIYLARPADDFRVYDDNAKPGVGATRRRLGRWLPFGHRSMREDPLGFASGAIEYDFDLRPRESVDYFVVLPLHDGRPDLDASTVQTVYDQKLAETIATWAGLVNRVEIRVPDPDLVNAFKANIAYNLVTRDGPALQPGSRSYDKSWMRDGSIAANALLEAGLRDEAREFIEWFAGFQLESGEVPPIIDTKAEDPLWEEKKNGLIEYDSQGEFIWVIAQYYRFTGDRAFLDKMFPAVVKSLQFMEGLRAKRLTAEFRDGGPDKKVFYGLLPESTSHEGYDRKHSYWDDFWALKGWEDARALAVALDRTDLLAWIDQEYADFKRCVYESIDLVCRTKGIDFIPGCAELGDIDPTSTAGALVYCDQLDALPKARLAHTFEVFDQDLRSRLEPGATYRFTPYEMRSVPALLRMGQKDKALALLRFQLRHRRPEAWNHFAEVAYSGERVSGYIGDMPHTWVGAEYINAVRSLFVYEQGDTLVLGAGIDPAWLETGQRMVLGSFPTCFGALSYEMEKRGDEVHVRVWGNAKPAGGLLFASPSAGPWRRVVMNGTPARLNAGGQVLVERLPVEIIFR